MEYRLNKIDTDARRKIIEKTSNGKIHKSGKADKIKEDKGLEKNKEKDKKHNLKKNYITVNGERKYSKNLEVDGEIEINKENSMGTILDRKG